MAAKEFFYPESKFHKEEVLQSRLVDHVADALSMCNKGERVFVIFGIEDYNDPEEMEGTETLVEKVSIDWL